MICRLGKGMEKEVKVYGPEKSLRTFTIFNLVDCLDQLKEQGYFYLKEWVGLGEEGGIWQGDAEERPDMAGEWIECQAPYSITALQMMFEHFLTGERKFLYVRKEELAYGEGTVMWVSDSMGGLNDNVGIDTWIRDKPPVLKGILQEMEMIPQYDVFQKVSVEALQELTGDSLFSLLYRLGFRQLREGWSKVKEDRFEEESIAWAGEFRGYHFTEWEYNFLYFVMIKREFEQWGTNCDGESACVWRESILDIYMARSQEPMDCVSLGDEKPIQLTVVQGVEEIKVYLDSFAKIDCMLATHKNENNFI